QVAARQHQDELFAAVASSHVVESQVGLQTAGYLGEDGVSRGMPQRVVDLLEAVHVRHDHSRRPSFALGADQFALERRQNFGAAQQVGKEIMSGGKSQTLLQIENP